jgi:hypothetical protein
VPLRRYISAQKQARKRPWPFSRPLYQHAPARPPRREAGGQHWGYRKTARTCRTSLLPAACAVGHAWASCACMHMRPWGHVRCACLLVHELIVVFCAHQQILVDQIYNALRDLAYLPIPHLQQERSVCAVRDCKWRTRCAYYACGPCNVQGWKWVCVWWLGVEARVVPTGRSSQRVTGYIWWSPATSIISTLAFATASGTSSCDIAVNRP